MNESSDLDVLTASSGTVALIAAAEIDQQIATAKKYPRSLKRFMDDGSAMVTLNESIARQCIYALPRDGKTIEGASARFGEIVASAWGNCRAGARVVNENGDFITAQGVFHDLERNVAITYEVQRRIVDSKGRRYKPDMIGVTANAACSIALRNAILKGVPKAFWEPLYVKARKVIAGDITTLANKRAEAIKQFAIFGVTEPMILAKLDRAGVADIAPDDLVTLFGLLTAIQEGDTTPEQAFIVDGAQQTASPQKPATYPEDMFQKNLPAWRGLIASGKKTVDQIVAMVATKGALTDEQIAKITAPDSPLPSVQAVAFVAAEFMRMLQTIADPEILDLKMEDIRDVDMPTETRAEITDVYKTRRSAIGA